MLADPIACSGSSGLFGRPAHSDPVTSVRQDRRFTPHVLPCEAARRFGHAARLRLQRGGKALLERLRMRRVALDRIRQRRHEQRRLARVELACMLTEIAPRRGFDAEYSVAPFRDVEIDFERATFRPDLAKDERDRDFDALAKD